MKFTFRRGQKVRLKAAPWGTSKNSKGRVSRVFKPGEGSGYDAKVRVRARKDETEMESCAQDVVNSMLD